jgi:hypothetical protein
MFGAVPTRFATGVLLFALISVVPSPARGRAPANPTPSQIQSAVRSAKQSRRLWATVNICDTHRHPNTIGIRGQAPALGFRASISIAIAIEFFNPSTRRFAPDPGVKKSISINNVSDGIQQAGVTFQFPRNAGRLRGSATFSWKRGGKLLGRTDRLTTGGHRNADFADPHGFSAATCTIT